MAKETNALGQAEAAEPAEGRDAGAAPNDGRDVPTGDHKLGDDLPEGTPPLRVWPGDTGGSDGPRGGAAEGDGRADDRPAGDAGPGVTPAKRAAKAQKAAKR